MLHTLSDAIGSQVPLYGAGTDGAGGSGPGTDIYESAIVVGNALAGDTVTDCTYLDPGDGTGLHAALVAAAALSPLRVDVFLRRGSYTVNPALVTLPMTIPGNVVLRGDDRTTTTITTGTGAGGTAQDLFAMAANSALLDFALVVPAPVAGVTAGNAIVDFQSNVRLERLAITVNEGAVQTGTPYVLSAYQPAPVSGVEVSDVSIAFVRSTGATFFYGLSLDFSNPAYSEPAKRNRVRNFRCTNSYSDAVFGLYSTIQALDVDGVEAVRAYPATVSTAQTISGTVAAASIANVVVDLRGVAAATVGGGPTIQCAFAAGGTNVLDSPRISGVTIFADTNLDATITLGAAVRGFGGLGTIKNAVIGGVASSGGANGALPVTVHAEASCTIDGGTITGCALGNGDINLEANGDSGVVDSVAVVGNACRNVLLNTVRVTKALVVGNRITGTYTDNGASTQAGLNNIG